MPIDEDDMRDLSEQRDEESTKKRKPKFQASSKFLWIILLVLSSIATIILVTIGWEHLRQNGSAVTQTFRELYSENTHKIHVKSHSLGEVKVQLSLSPGETVPGNLHTSVGIGYPGHLDEEILAEIIKEHQPQITNAVQGVIARYVSSELQTSVGRKLAQTQLVAALNKFLADDQGGGLVKEVYLTNFQVVPGR